jgi:hypothetical protein
MRGCKNRLSSVINPSELSILRVRRSLTKPDLNAVPGMGLGVVNRLSTGGRGRKYMMGRLFVTTDGDYVMTQGSDGLPPGALGQVDTFRCIGCGYILKLADPLGNCPGCGKLVSESRVVKIDPPETLSGADRGWVTVMAQGVSWLAYFYIGYVGVVCLISCLSAGAVIVMIAGSMKAGGPPPQLPDLSGLKYVIALATAINYCMVMVFLVILERITRPEPGRALEPDLVERIRHVGRIALPIIGVGMTIVLPFQIYTSLTQSYDPQSPPPVSVWAMAGMVFGLGVFGVLMCLATTIPAQFAGRVGSKKLDKQARRVVIYAAVCWGTWVVATPLSLIGPMSGNQAVQAVGGCVSCPFMLAAFVGGVLFMVEGIINALAVGKAAKNLLEPVQ